MDDEPEAEEILLTPGAVRAIEQGDALLEVRFKRLDHSADSITLEGNVAFWIEVAEALYEASLTDSESQVLYDAFCNATDLVRDDDESDDIL